MSCMVDTMALKKIMIEKKVETIEALSKKSGVNRNTISEVLNAKIRPSTSVMDRMVIALEISPEVAGKIFFASDLRNS